MSRYSDIAIEAREADPDREAMRYPPSSNSGAAVAWAALAATPILCYGVLRLGRWLLDVFAAAIY